MEMKNELGYEIVITNQGNGNWYHGFENPLKCRFVIVGNKATCPVCEKVLEIIYKHENNQNTQTLKK